MSLLTTHFSEQELNAVQQGIHRFIRLTGLIYDSNPLVWCKWFTDESDLKAALRSVGDTMKSTHTMLGKRKYQGIDFDAPNEVRKDLFTFLTNGVDDAETALLRKRNLPMYHLVIEPVCQLFYKFDHSTMIEVADQLVNELISMVDATTDYGTYADALIAQQQVQELIRSKDEAKKEALAAKKRKGKRRDPLLALLASLAPEPDQCEDDETSELYA